MREGRSDFAATEESRKAITGQFLVKGCHHIARQFALGYSIQIFGMATELQTVRVRWTWLDKLQCHKGGDANGRNKLDPLRP
jgi:hypothetical protein